MSYNAQVKDKEIIWSSQQYQNAVMDKLEGKKIKIAEDEDTTPKLRKFFEGAVVKYFFYQHEAFTNFKEARESLKLEFNAEKVLNLKTGNYQMQGGSTSGKSLKWWSNEQKNGFLDRIERYFIDNGYEYPDSEAYNEWLEKETPSINEIYPPLKKIIEAYKAKATLPVWRK